MQICVGLFDNLKIVTIFVMLKHLLGLCAHLSRWFFIACFDIK
nr:MAG TPA: hypothetical protein [Caudoviricetes sp.]